MTRTLFALFVALSAVPTTALAAPITFDLRDPSIELIDEVNSFDLTRGGLIATLTAWPDTYLGNDVVLNQTTSSFGINVVGETCGGLENSAQVDGGCTGEYIAISFDADVMLNSLRISSFGSGDSGSVSVNGLTPSLLSSGLVSLGNVYLTSGDSFVISYLAGTGFSVDNFTVTPTSVPEPGSLVLLSVGIFGIVVARRRFR